MKLRTLIPLILAVGILPQTINAQSDAPLAKIVVVGAADGMVTRRFFGQVAARETVDLAFQVGGQILDFPVVEGDTIAQGALVAQLDLEPFDLAVRQAQAQQDQADRAFARLEQLRSTAVSQVAIDDAETAAQLAEISTRNAIRSQEQATLVAPFDAQVAVRLVANFTTVAAGTPVVRLHDMSELHIEIEVPEVLFQNSTEDPTMSIWAEFPGRDKRYPLTIREFVAQTSEVGQTIGITLAMEQPDDQLILPGSSATVFAQIEIPDRGHVVPQGAIVTANDGTAQVLVFEPSGDDAGTVHLTPVEISPTETGEVMLNSGLETGQEIVASGAAYLTDGQAVRRFTGFPN